MKQTAARVYAGLFSGALCGLMLFSYISLEQIAWLWRQSLTCGAPWILVAEHNFTDDISVEVRRLLHAPKLFCLVLTYPANYDTKAIHCQNTWVRRCDKYWFLGSEPHASLKLINANVSFQEGRSQLWRKMRQIWPIVARVDFPYDYVYKADDDTYAVVENMRFALAGFDSQDPFMTGFTWPSEVPGGFFSGGAGYVLSQAAVRRFVILGFDFNKLCPPIATFMEDVRTTECARQAGVRTVEFLHDDGVQLLHPYSLASMFDEMNTTPQLMDLYSQPFVRRARLGFSARHIGFHYMDAVDLYITEFITYHLRPVGVS